MDKSKKNIVKLDDVKLPIDSFKLDDDELLVVKGGQSSMVLPIDSGSGSGCGCGCGCGC